MSTLMGAEMAVLESSDKISLTKQNLITFHTYQSSSVAETAVSAHQSVASHSLFEHLYV
jgi:hypothetical protein